MLGGENVEEVLGSTREQQDSQDIGLRRMWEDPARLSLFLEVCARTLDRYREGVAMGCPDSIVDAAHKLRASARTLGGGAPARPLTSLLEQIETAAVSLALLAHRR